MELALIQKTLIAYLLEQALWPDVDYGALTLIGRGWESDIYRLEVLPTSMRDARLAPASLVLRYYPAEDALQKSAREFSALQNLYRAGYPVPRPYLLEQQASILGKPFIIMEFIEGEQMWQVIDRSSPEHTARLLGILCDLLARLHHLDWRLFTSEKSQDPYHWVDTWLQNVAWALDNYQMPAFQPLLDWLQSQRDRVPCFRPAPLHGDFHPANILLQPEGKAVVVDWTQFEVGDPRFDLAWTMLLVGAYEGEELRPVLLDLYQAAHGEPVQEFDYFDMAVCVKRLAHFYISLTQSPEKTGMQSRAADAMRGQFAIYQRIYDRLVAGTSVHIPELEDLLSS
jgi:aminoglycoside phosphotransferase (APT) family kinase protein